jgi:hypothetical protein
MSGKKPGKSGQRKPTAPTEPKPVPPMPSVGRRGAHWLAATRRTWAGWFESGRAGHDAVQLAALERLIRLVDQANRSPADLAIAKEVRLQERALGLTSTARSQHAAANPWESWREQRHRARQREHDHEPLPVAYDGTEQEWRAMSLRERFEFNALEMFKQWERESADPTRRATQRCAEIRQGDVNA